MNSFPQSILRGIRLWFEYETLRLPRVLLLSFLIFFVVQLYWLFSGWWDPIVYALHGEWFCGVGNYFEWLRPPLPGAVHCLAGAGGWAPFLSIMLASILYFIAVVWLYYHFSKKEKINSISFSLFAFLFPTILIHSNGGGDIFALAFLILSFLVPRPWMGGALFGLATLSRYNYLFFLPILFYHYRKSIVSFSISSIIVWVPWLWYNYSLTGNAFFSVDESFYLNVIQKGVFTIPDISVLFPLSVYFIILMTQHAHFQKEWKWTAIGIISFIMVLFSGIKESRFLLPTIPSQTFLVSSTSAPHSRLMFGILFVSLLVSGIGLVSFTFIPLHLPDLPALHDCRVMSDKWVNFYSQNIVAEPLPGKNDFELFLSQGAKLVVFDQSLVSPEVRTRFAVEETAFYVVLSSSDCEPQPESYVLKVWRG
ncbi:MAG: hypothetical protein V1776_05195 [Candidatus Diapherotrites archaeon]